MFNLYRFIFLSRTNVQLLKTFGSSLIEFIESEDFTYQLNLRKFIFLCRKREK